MLNATANWLASPNNEAMLLAEENDDSLKIVAESCILSAQLLRQAAEEVDSIEPPDPSLITPEAVAEMAELASALDASGDPALMKQASVLDELLLSIAAKPGEFGARKDLAESRIEDLRRRYQDPSKEHAKQNKVSATEKAIEKSKMTDKPMIRDQPLSSRYCPDHPSAQVSRIGEHRVSCSLDHKIYDYETGYTLNDGTKVPGGDVSLQGDNMNIPFQSLFDTREGRLNSNRF
jgi:hypothetical protein